ncbi:MAG: nucleoside transporter C-terminal domain-containing protein, partial [Pseudomonadota bacterium]
VGAPVGVGFQNSYLKFAAKFQQTILALIVVTGVATLVTNQLPGNEIFAKFSEGVEKFLGLAAYGAKFLFANLANPEYNFPGPEGGWPGFGFLFAFHILPTIIFFGGFMSVLYYFGIMQKVIVAMSRFMRWTIGTSGVETLSCTANIFVGQTEAPLLIKPFLGRVTNSELLTIMVGGFATVAGGVLAGYIVMGVPAGHLVAAAVMSAPAALVVGKIIMPELDRPQSAGEVQLPDVSVGGNVIEAATNGITDGLKLAVNVGAMLLGFIALIAVLDLLLNQLDKLIDGYLLGGALHTYSSGGMSPVEQEYGGVFPGSLQTLFGFLLKPLAWSMGVPWAEAGQVGNLLGIKLSLNEFVSFAQLGDYIQSGAISEKAIIISTYALCGFANFSSIGIQIGGFGSLAPERRSDLAKVGLRAMFGGAIASWMTASIAGFMLT